MDLDLGIATQANVKVNGEIYKLRLPTVLEADEFRKKAKDDNALDMFSQFIVKLGLPKEIVYKLDIHQFTKLSEGLLGMTEKK